MKRARFLLPLLMLGSASCICGDDQNNLNGVIISGTVNGLLGHIVLQLNGAGDVTLVEDGTFSFLADLDTGASYAVTVSGQPTGQTCAVTAAGSGTVADNGVTGVVIDCSMNSFTVGGTVAGSSGAVSLRLLNGDTINVPAAGTFTFATAVHQGDSFNVAVVTSPAGQTCVVSGGVGVIGLGSVTTVTVNCATTTYTIGGTVTGLLGSHGSIVLKNNGTETIKLTANGTYAFPTTQLDTTGYSVTMEAVPAIEPCTLTNPSGTVAAANVVNVNVTCIPPNFSENFDGVSAPSLPSTMTAPSGGWITTAATPDTAPNAAFIDDPSFVTDRSLVMSSPYVITSATAHLTFRHYYQTEPGFDGGVLEVSMNGGPFIDIRSVAAAGAGAFVSGGYNATISTSWMSPIGGRQAWAGNSGGYVTTDVTLGANFNGVSTVFRWRMATDNSVAATGWRIDTIAIL